MSTDTLAVLDRARELNGVTDEATATAALDKARGDLFDAGWKAHDARLVLRDSIVRIRPTGILTVDEMAGTIGRDRNFIDSVWSAYGTTTKGKQTRVEAVTDPAREHVVDDLENAASNVKHAESNEVIARASRDRTVAMVYASKILGPSAIAAAVGVDRNHVLRIARKAGVPPQHRKGAKNQYSRKRKSS